MAFHLKVVTPKKLVIEQDIISLTVPAHSGQITLLPRHIPMVTLLKEGIMTVRTNEREEYLSIGGGYVETDGSQVTVLVSRAYNQGAINEEFTRTAKEQAEKILAETKDKTERTEAISQLRRSTIDLDLLRKIRKKTQQ